MVFSTVPVYHQDPPNWHLHLQQNLQQENITGNDQLQQQQQQLPPLPPSSYTGGDSGEGSYPGSIRPGSMSDRARLAKIPQPEVALKCPRCESTNTKFCYFNNYSLTQPRHFCKMCRRYWTRGGALRNVPVGGGCRRNKKSKPSSSKSKGGSATTSNSSTSTDQRHKIITSSGSTSTDHVAPRDIDNYMMSSHQNYPQPPQLPFLSSLQNLTHFGNIDPGQTSNINLSADHQQWSNSSSMQQFPFMAGGFDNNVNVPFSFQNGSMPTVMMMTSGASRVCDQVGAGAVKREETLNTGKAARPFLGIVNNEQYYSSPWGGHGGSSSTWNNATGSADGRDDDQMPGQQLNSSAATTHFL